MVCFSSVLQGPALAIPEEVSACVLSFKHIRISHGFHKQEECFEADMHYVDMHYGTAAWTQLQHLVRSSRARFKAVTQHVLLYYGLTGLRERSLGCGA